MGSAAQYGYDTVKIYFPINITVLDKAAEDQLDSVAKTIQQNSLLIYGYADYLGKEPANMDLAKARAHQVAQRLLSRKIKQSSILICEGIGQVSRNLEKNREGFPEDRRVDVFIKRERMVSRPVPVKENSPGKMKVSEITTTGALVPLKNSAPKLQPATPAIKPQPEIKKTAEQKTSSISRDRKVAHTGIEKLAGLKPNEVMRIESIHFLPTRHFLTKDSEPIVEELLQTLIKFPRLAIRIEGHVCCVKGETDALDTDTYELKLSENRAHYIYWYLIDGGISADRLEYAGFGKRRPIVPVEQTEEDAQKNRRVEIRVLRN